MDLLFDLDGTLTNPEEGITRCIQFALEAVGPGPLPERSSLRRCIGPPLQESFAELLETSDSVRIDEAITKYRERYTDVGILENELYDDIPGGLAALRQAGHRLWVATSKPRVFAERVVALFDLTSFFEKVYGAELDGTNSAKSDLIATILSKEQLDRSEVCMIGDRSHDIVGGRANRTYTVGVLWGFGTEAELRQARPDAVVDSMSGLQDSVKSLGKGRS